MGSSEHSAISDLHKLAVYIKIVRLYLEVSGFAGVFPEMIPELDAYLLLVVGGRIWVGANDIWPSGLADPSDRG